MLEVSVKSVQRFKFVSQLVKHRDIDIGDATAFTAHKVVVLRLA